jgi:CHAD domain-containing protein
METRPTRVPGRNKVSSAQLDCATAFQKIARDCVASIKAHHSGARAADAEAVHQIRVAITRLRAAVMFFAPIVIDAEWLRLKREIAWLNVSLGAARDSDVSMEYTRRERYRKWAEREIGDDLARRRVRDHQRLLTSLRSSRFQRLIAAMADWVEGGPWLVRWERRKRHHDAHSLDVYCTRELNRWRKRLIRKGRDLEDLSTSRRHRLRIRSKRFRYMLEALTETVALRRHGELKHLHGPAKRLQRALGDHRDLARLAGLARSSKGDGGKRKPPPGYRRRKQKLMDDAVEAYRSLKQAGVC